MNRRRHGSVAHITSHGWRIRTLLLCAAGTLETATPALAQSGGVQPPVLTAFSINGGANTVAVSVSFLVLGHTIVGRKPSEYRVSHRSDFAGAVWHPYTESPKLKDWLTYAADMCDAGRSSRRITLFLQVRAMTGTEVRIVDGQRALVPATVESNVLRDSICAVGSPPD